MRNLAAAVFAVAILGACSSNAVKEAAVTTPPPAVTTVSTEPATTESVTPTTESPTTTSVAPVTTVAPTTVAETTTTLPTPTGYGLVWASGVDPARVNTSDGQPTGEAHGISSRVDMVVVLSTTGSDQMSGACKDAAQMYSELKGGDPATGCLLVQWEFDVATDFRVNQNSPEGGLTSGDLVTADGKQITSVYITTGYPGTKNNLLSEVYAFGGPGSVVRWETGSNLVGYTTFSYTVPPIDQMQPVYFD